MILVLLHIIYIIAGSVVSFGTVLYSCFWLLYTFNMVLKLLYPLKSSRLFNTEYSRVIHTAELLIALFIATAPSAVGIGLSRYRINTFPPRQCDSYGEFRLYSLIVPVMVAVCVSVTLMLLTLYKIHMVSMMMYNKVIAIAS